MTTLFELVATAPAAAAGYPTQLAHGDGLWRVVVELADPAAGSSVEWFDITQFVSGWSNVRGADQYAGRYRVSVVNVDLWCDDDRLAPWNPDTSPTFGVHVDLGPGLIMRGGFIRVLDSAVVEWNPRWTNRVERWGDDCYGRGQIRRHPIVAKDLLTALVNVPIAASSEANWSDRVDYIVDQSGWPFGSQLFGATVLPGPADVLTVPARPAADSALTELQATCDPAGAVYFTDRRGVLLIRPATWDTFHTDAFTAGAAGDEWNGGDVTPVTFTYLAEDDAGGVLGYAAYAVDSSVEPFGFDKTEEAIINHVVRVGPGGTFDDDDPISIQRYDRKTDQASWIADNDQAAADLLDYRADAVVEARPLYTTLDTHGFFPGPASLDYLGYVAILHQTAAGRPTAFGNGWVRQYTERVAPRGPGGTSWNLSIIVDIYSVDTEDSLLPPEDLLLVDVTDVAVEFSWTNPTQTVTPTHTQIRMMNTASLWATVAYPITGTIWGALDPSSDYTFQVRYIRVVDGVVTHVSPSRSWAFTTDTTTIPDVDDDGVTFPEPDEDCTLEWKLDESGDGTTWSTVDTGTVTEAPWEIATPAYAYDGSKLYRICSREVCSGTPGAYVCSNLFAGECSDPPALAAAPFDDAALRFYLPAICPTDVIVEAVSEDPATTGAQFDTFVIDGDGNVALVSAAEGVVCYGANPDMDFTPGLDGLTEDTTLSCKILVTTQPDAPVAVFGAAGLWIEVLAEDANWKVRARCHESGSGITTITGATQLDFGAWYDLAVTHDVASGDFIVYIDGVEEASALGTVTERHNPGLYECVMPAESLITNMAVWARVLAPEELPGYVLPPSVDIDLEVGQSDPTTDTAIQFTATFSEAVTGFATGDVTLAGTAGATTVTVLGSGAVYTLTVTGMTTAGTVVVSIPAGVCTSIATSAPNTASTHTDNSVDYTHIGLSAAIMALSPLGYWKLDETSGTQATDSSGNTRHGTYSGTYTLNAATGADGLPLPSFNGGRVSIADNNVWSVGQAPGLTVFAICKPSSVAGTTRQFIVSKGNTSNFEWEVTANHASAARLSAQLYGFAGATRSLHYVTSVMSSSAWNVVVFRYPSTAQNATQLIYRNGTTALTTTGPGTTSAEAYINGSAALQIAHRGDSPSGQQFVGQIARVAIFAGSIDLSTVITAADNEGWF